MPDLCLAVRGSYCDGGSFSGNNETVTTYQNTSLYFRGKRVREAAYASLLASGLDKATDVVISGCSAGGLATYLHTDQWCDAIRAAAPGVKCVGMPDSGFFLDHQKKAANSTPASAAASSHGSSHVSSHVSSAAAKPLAAHGCQRTRYSRRFMPPRVVARREERRRSTV